MAAFPTFFAESLLLVGARLAATGFVAERLGFGFGFGRDPSVCGVDGTVTTRVDDAVREEPSPPTGNSAASPVRPLS